MASKAPGVVYNVIVADWDPALLVQHVVESGYAWLALMDSAPTLTPGDFGQFVSSGQPRVHPEVATLARAAGLKFGIVARSELAPTKPNSNVTPWTNSSCQDSLSFWSPDFLLYGGVDGYWPGAWNADRLDIASFTAANPGAHLALLTGNVRGAWAYVNRTGAYGETEGPQMKARLQAFAAAGWQVVCDPNGGSSATDPPTSANTIAAAEALGWAANDIGVSYYLTPGRYPGWGTPADMAATAGQWAATDRWPFDSYDYAWCMADGWFHGRLP